MSGSPVQHDRPGGAAGGLPEPRRPAEATSGLRRGVTLVDRLIEREIEREIEDGLRRLDRLTAAPRRGAPRTAAEDVRPGSGPETGRARTGSPDDASDVMADPVAPAAQVSDVLGAGSRFVGPRTSRTAGAAGAEAAASTGPATPTLLWRPRVPGTIGATSGPGLVAGIRSGGAFGWLAAVGTTKIRERRIARRGPTALVRPTARLVVGVGLVVAAACLALTLRPVVPAPFVDTTAAPPGPVFVIHPDGLRVGMAPRVLPVRITDPSALPLTVTGIAPAVDRLPADCPASAWWMEPASSPEGAGEPGLLALGGTIPPGGGGATGLAVALAAGAPAGCADRAIDLDVLVAGTVGGAPVELTGAVTLVTGPSTSPEGTGLPRNAD